MVELASEHLTGENYSNKKLLKKAGEKALTIAGEYFVWKKFRAYANICFYRKYDSNNIPEDIIDNGSCPFRATEIFRKAALKAVEYKEEAPNKMYLNRFIGQLKRNGRPRNLRFT